eukprot:4183452-Amphidinium_carterae.2
MWANEEPSPIPNPLGCNITDGPLHADTEIQSPHAWCNAALEHLIADGVKGLISLLKHLEHNCRFHAASRIGCMIGVGFAAAGGNSPNT